MYSLYFDPFLLAAPLGNDKDSFYEHIKNLLNWRDICQEKWINGYLPLETVNILTMANCYPFKENLQKSMNHYEILDIQIQDVIKVINQLMFELNYIEDIQYYTQFEIKEFISQEKIFIEKRNNYFLDSIFNIIAFIGLADHLKLMTLRNQYIVTRGLVGGSIEIPIELTLDYINKDNDELITGDLKFDAKLCNEVDSFSDSIDIIEFIKKYRDEKAIRFIMKIELLKKVKECSIIELKNWELNSNFINYVIKCDCINNESRLRSLIRSCIETIIGLNLGDSHALRITKHQNSPVRVRSFDSAQAWRRDVDDEYHLHYWVLGNYIEFASVDVHNAFDIPE